MADYHSSGKLEFGSNCQPTLVPTRDFHSRFQRSIVRVGLTAFVFFPPQAIIIASAQEPPPPAVVDSLSEDHQEFAPTLERWEQDLVESGWSEDAANIVIALNTPRWQTTYMDYPAPTDLEIAKLQRLGSYPSVMAFLEEHPQSAGQLAMAENPDLIARTIPSTPEESAIVEGMYMPYSTPEGLQALAEALDSSGDSMVGLVKRGLTSREVVFLFERNGEVGQEYDRWLRETTKQRLLSSDAELASFMDFALHMGVEIRLRMSADPDFLKNFRAEIWPKLVRITSRTDGLLDRYAADPRVLDILSLPEGEPLLERCGPELPLNLLYGSPEHGLSAYPQELHEIVIQSLLQGDDETVDALIKFRDEPTFRDFLARELAHAVRTAAINKLLQADTDYPSRLIYYSRLDDSALAAEVGPAPSGPITWVPGYDVYTFSTKIAQGREYSGLDVLLATVDAASFIPTVKVVTAAGKAGAKTALKQTIRKAGAEFGDEGVEKQIESEMTGYFVKIARERATLHLGKDAAEQLTKTQLIRYGTPGVLSEAAKATKLAIDNHTTVDITKPIQYFFSHTSVSRNSLKRLTGLDARVFMRGDARVVITFNKTIPGAAVTAFMSETAQSMAIGAAADTEIGRAAIRTAYTKFDEAEHKFEDWQKIVAAWWLMNASGLLDVSAEENPQSTDTSAVSMEAES